MLVTQKEAYKKLCKTVHYQENGQVFTYQIYCEADACMKWRWDDDNLLTGYRGEHAPIPQGYQVRTKDKYLERIIPLGYCGEGGKP